MTTDPVQIIYGAIEDAMTPAAYDSHHGGYWLSDLPPDLLAQRIVTALRDHLIPDHADRIGPDTWPAVAEGITVRAIRQALPDLPPSAPTVIARRIMADLHAAGQLPTTRTQWGVQSRNTVTTYIDEATAREQAKLLRDAGHPARLLRRTVTYLDMMHTSDWEPATEALAGSTPDTGSTDEPA